MVFKRSITRCGLNASPMLEIRHEIRQPAIAEGAPRDPRRLDRRLDRVWFSFDLDQRIHPRIRLESYSRATELVLRDLAIDLGDHFQTEFAEYDVQGSEIVDRSADLFANLVDIAEFGWPLPVEKSPGRCLTDVSARPHNLVAGR